MVVIHEIVSVCLSIHLSVCLSILSVCLSIYPICLYVCLSVHLSCLSVCLSVYRKQGLGPVLIVSPATVLHQWVAEFHKWWPPFRVAVLHGTGSHAGSKKRLVQEMVEGEGGRKSGVFCLFVCFLFFVFVCLLFVFLG